MDPWLKENLGPLLQWAATAIIGVVAWYVRDLNKRNETLRAAMHRLREANQEWRSAADMEILGLRSAIRLVAERAKVRYEDIDELCMDRRSLQPKPDSSTMT